MGARSRSLDLDELLAGALRELFARRFRIDHKRIEVLAVVVPGRLPGRHRVALIVLLDGAHAPPLWDAYLDEIMTGVEAREVAHA